MIRFFFCSILSVLILSSCKKSGRPDDVLQPNRMQAVLWDVLQANAYVTEFIRKDSALNIEQEQVKLQQRVFSKHKVSRTEFDKSYNWYVQHPVQMQSMLDTMIARAGRDKKTKLLQAE